MDREIFSNDFLLYGIDYGRLCGIKRERKFPAPPRPVEKIWEDGLADRRRNTHLSGVAKVFAVAQKIVRV
jgi:hypothetical protein